jgi:hypothetical protein
MTPTDVGDGLDEALTGTATVALTASARAGEHLARMREQSQRAAQAQAQQSGQQFAARLAAEQQAATAYFAAVSRPDYLEHASAQDLADAHRQAVVWRDSDPSAAHAEQLLAEYHRQRFGTHPTPAWSSDQVTAAALVAGADAADQDAQSREETAGPQQPDDSLEWDSRERRQELADTLHQTVDNPAAVQARLTADTANARPPHDAVRPGAGQATSPRRTPALERVREAGLEPS